MHFPTQSSQSSPSFSIGDRKFSYPASFTPPSFPPLPPSPIDRQAPGTPSSGTPSRAQSHARVPGPQILFPASTSSVPAASYAPAASSPPEVSSAPAGFVHAIQPSYVSAFPGSPPPTGFVHASGLAPQAALQSSFVIQSSAAPTGFVHAIQSSSASQPSYASGLVPPHQSSSAIQPS